MAPLPPASPSSWSGAASSPSSRSLLHSNSGGEWNVVVQRNIKSLLLLLLVLSTVFVFSVVHSSSRGFSAATSTAGEAISQIALDTDVLETTSRLVPGEEQPADQEPVAVAEGVATAGQSASADVSAPSTGTAEQTGGDQSEAGYQVQEKCDMSRGKWVSEPRGPVYTNLTCPTIPPFKNCQKFGKDPGHLFWRWQPDGCDLPRFAPERFLDVVRGKRLAFIGDSLARNQMESLLCLLSQVETPVNVYADALDKFDKFRTWHFPAHNFTLMVMWTEFYAHAEPVLDAAGKPTPSFNIHLDRLNANWTSRLPELDYAVLSGSNWFFRRNYLWEGGRRVGCIFCRDANLTDLGVAYAVRRVVRAALHAVARCRGCSDRGLVTFLRTYSPDHFEGGSWFDGGYCNRTRPLEEGELSAGHVGWELRRLQREEVARAMKAHHAAGSRRRFGVLDVTRAMMLRVDGHPGGHYDKRWGMKASDCLHWCLPGPVDMWNEVLLQRIAEISPPTVAR